MAPAPDLLIEVAFVAALSAVPSPQSGSKLLLNRVKRSLRTLGNSGTRGVLDRLLKTLTAVATDSQYAAELILKDATTRRQALCQTRLPGSASELCSRGLLAAPDAIIIFRDLIRR